MNSFVKAAAFVAAIAGLLTNASCKKQGKQIALNSWDIWHWFIVKTCIRHWRHDGGLYPIPIDEDE